MGGSLWILLLWAICVSASPLPAVFELTLFPDTTQAKCNDGTPAGYYTWRSENSNPNWIIYLQGGGLCFDELSCKSRSSILTSSSEWGKTLVHRSEGLLGNQTDSAFAQWNKAFVPYCTSDLYSGTGSPNQNSLGWYFRGHEIVPAVLDALKSELSLASEVLFTGGSAGGVGTFMNYPFVKASLSHAHVRALPDAGWFLLVPPYSNSSIPVAPMIQVGMALWKGVPPTACADALGRKSAMCYSGPVVYPYMPAPPSDIMVLKSQNDEWTLGHDGIKAPLSKSEVVWLEALAADVKKSFVKDSVTNVFSANCIYHTAEVGKYDTLIVDNVTLHQAVEDWFFKGETVHLVDSCTTVDCNTASAAACLRV